MVIANRLLVGCFALAGACQAPVRTLPDGPPAAPARDSAAVVADAARSPADAGAPDAAADGACVPADLGAFPADPRQWPSCCTAALCAQVGAVCNAQTCRCELIRCTKVGAPCDPSLLPGVVCGTLECAAAPGGSFCFVRASAPEQCPAGMPSCGGAVGTAGCLCGLGCRLFSDDCPGKACRPVNDQTAVGECGPRGYRDEGTPCTAQHECLPQLLCSNAPPDVPGPVCTRLECGFAEGAPACPPGRVCLPIDRFGMLGFCRAPCDPYALDSCPADDEVCVWAGAAGASPAYCARVTEPLHRLGEDCAGWCRSGLSCAAGTCRKVCDPAAADPSAPAGCPAAHACVPDPNWNGVPFVGVCAPSCDPWTTAPTCDAASYCVVSAVGQQTVGGCMPRWPDLPGLDARCWGSCDGGLTCSGGWTSRCRPICRVGASPGATGRCAPEEHCFGLADPKGFGLLPYGFCDRPCEPGAGDCDRGLWCEPRELDPTTSRWVGTCDAP